MGPRDEAPTPAMSSPPPFVDLAAADADIAEQTRRLEADLALAKRARALARNVHTVTKRALKQCDNSPADALAALVTAAGLHPLDSPDFFTTLPAVDGTDLSHVSATFFPSMSALFSNLAPPSSARSGLFYIADKGQNVRFEKYTPDMPVELLMREGEGKIIDDVEGIIMTPAQCATLQNLGIIALERPRHALFATWSPATGAAINDPNESSLQVEECIHKDIHDPADALYSAADNPGGWCQTWSWFEAECAVMGCPGLHATLKAYFASDENGIFSIKPDPNMPPAVARLVDAMAPKSGIRIGDLVAFTGAGGAEIKGYVSAAVSAGPLVYEVLGIGVGAHNVAASELAYAGPDGYRPGFGLTLTAFVRKLAARYNALIEFCKRRADAGLRDFVVATDPSRPVAVYPMPAAAAPANADPKAAQIDRVMAAFADKTMMPVTIHFED